MDTSLLGNEQVVEEWRIIPEFPDYEVSNMGNIYNNRSHMMMKVSANNYGYPKITFTNPKTHVRYTRAVAKIVAEAFVPRPDEFCDQVVVLDNNVWNMAAMNLAWRPEGFAWRYAHQFKGQLPLEFISVPVLNIFEGRIYRSVKEAGMTEGLLFEDIWVSSYTGKECYPTGSVFEIIQ